MGTSKTNSEHSSTNSRENTPRKRSFKSQYCCQKIKNNFILFCTRKVPRQNVETVNPSVEQAPPPDVLNVNAQTQIGSEGRFSLSGLEVDLSRLLTVSCHSNLADGESGEEQRVRTPKKYVTLTRWNTSKQTGFHRNKLLDELRENVYKEVASLISANEARPHFLIQLFKDLQKIESDSLRLKILQSVQNILTQSMGSKQEPMVDETIVSPWARTNKQFSSDILNLRLVGKSIIFSF